MVIRPGKLVGDASLEQVVDPVSTGKGAEPTLNRRLHNPLHGEPLLSALPNVHIGLGYPA
jgi:hypothetical protein